MIKYITILMCLIFSTISSAQLIDSESIGNGPFNNYFINSGSGNSSSLYIQDDSGHDLQDDSNHYLIAG